jgi:Flp pilus assembly pilin Flp
MNRIHDIEIGVVRLLAGGRLRREDGQTLVEYALIIATIAIAVTAAMVFLSDQISTLFSNVGSDL